MTRQRSAPLPTIVGLVGTLALVAFTVVVEATGGAGDSSRTTIVLALLTALFTIRVAGQVVVLVAGPRWLPPMKHWNLLPYSILLPTQLVLLSAMVSVTADLARGAPLLPAGGPAVGVPLVAAACAYAAGMAVRYAVRMTRRPDQRWFGGAIPIVFHSVLAGWLLALGLFHAGG